MAIGQSRSSFGIKLPAVLVVLIMVGSCRSSVPTYLDGTETDFDVGLTWYGSNLRIYHSALLYAHALGLRSPRYVVGVESIHPSGAARAEMHGSGQEGHVITHIIRYHTVTTTTPSGTIDSCVLYTILDRHQTDADAGHRLFRRCEPHSDLGGDDPNLLPQDVVLFDLRRAIVQDLRKAEYSHIIIMVMGWNTNQEEALRNINEITGQLVDEAAARQDTKFRPLLIGVTWPSQWQLGGWSVLPDALVRGLSFPNKAHDANDVGISVLQPLILNSVLAARSELDQPNDVRIEPKSPSIVLIGHSFGARALVAALAQSAVVDARFRPDDRLILLEGAFEIQHLFRPDGDLNPAFAKGAPRVTMTASANDSAVSAAIWGWYAGDIDTFDQVCRQGGRLPNLHVGEVGCANAVRPDVYGLGLCVNTAMRPVPGALEGKPVRYFDASRMINCHAPFSAGGGAHSDIFRRETARFLMDEMNQ